ncbi:MAG: rod shape-determining protein MreC, partial [Candidatus Margulisbacteria bacterium]|nr:rod shape-determining protein MreC [Candidatus Margulisiibacteriota bacterium]
MTSIRSYRKKKSFILPLILLFLAAALLLTSPLYIRTVFSVIAFPFEAAGSAVWRGVISVPSAVISIASTSRQNSLLKKELRRYKTKVKLLDELIIENNRLRSMLNYRENSSYFFDLLPADIIGKAPSPWYTILEVNRGSNSGIRNGAAVVFREGLVGRVVSISPFSAKVMLITDSGSSIAAIDSRSRDFGVVEGGSGNKLSMRYVGAG